MLSCARRAATRTLPITSRRVSTNGSSTDGLLDESLATLGGMLNLSDAPSLSPPPPTSSPQRYVPPPKPPVINIPPAEDPLLHYLTSWLTKNGKRHTAARITSRTLLYIHTLTRAEPLPILRQAVANVSPAVRCISNKHAGKTVVYPVALSEKQRTRYALEWILKAAASRQGQQVEERLAREVVAIVQGMSGEGRPEDASSAYKNKEAIHKLAMMNRGNALRIS